MLLAILIIAVVVFIAALLSEWWICSYSDERLFIKYSYFWQSYKANPEKWMTRENYVLFKKSDYSRVPLQFYPVGYYRYKSLIARAQKKTRKAARKSMEQEIMSIIQPQAKTNPIPNFIKEYFKQDEN